LVSNPGTTSSTDGVPASSRRPPGVRRAIWSCAVGIVLISAGAVVATALLLAFLALSSSSYIWVISGPGVLGQMGGGPFQLVMYVGGLLLTLTLFTAGVALVRHALQISSRP